MAKADAVPTTATDEPERVTPEVVEEPRGEVVAMVAQHSALERAADAAMAMPGIPGRDEFLSLAMQARILSLSDVAPKALRGNPHVAFHIGMIGRDLGISLSAAIELIDVIGEGQDARPSMSPQLLNGQIRRLGLGRIVPVETTAERCVARALGPHDEILGPDVEFTWEDAQIAGLVDDRCPDPKNHWKPTNGNGRCGCRQGYRTYPKRMLWWRASGFAADDYFPEAGLGLYSPEELGAVVDDAGRPLDPATVELPEGYAPKVNEAQRQAVTVAAADELWLLQERIAALPTQEKADLRDRWQQSKLKGRAASRLVQADVNFARSMVAGFEKIAARGGEWTAEGALEGVREAQVEAVTAWLLLGWHGSYRETEPTDPTTPTEPTVPTPTTPAVEPPAAPDTADVAVDPGDGSRPAEGTTAGDAPEATRLEQVIARVQKLTPGELTGALQVRKLPATGNDDSRRRRLCEAILEDDAS